MESVSFIGWSDEGDGSILSIMRSYLQTLLLILLFIVFPTREARGEDYSAALRGKRLIHEAATCAGWAFTTDGSVVRYDELICSRGRETGRYKIKWLNQSSFVLIEEGSSRDKHACPPRAYIYSIESLTAHSIRLRSIETGWGDSQDDIENFSLMAMDDSTVE